MDRPGPPIVVDLSTREACLGTLERVCRAIQAGRIKPATATAMGRVIGAALLGYPTLSDQGAANRSSRGVRAAKANVAADPIGPPEPDEPEPLVADEPTFEERIEAAEADRKKAAERELRKRKRAP